MAAISFHCSGLGSTPVGLWAQACSRITLCSGIFWEEEEGFGSVTYSTGCTVTREFPLSKQTVSFWEPASLATTMLIHLDGNPVSVLQRCLPELLWSRSRRWRGRSTDRLWAACRRLWRWVCGFPRRVWADTHHVGLRGTETVDKEKTQQVRSSDMSIWFILEKKQQQQNNRNSPKSWLRYAEIQFLRWSGPWCSVEERWDLELKPVRYNLTFIKLQ